MESQDSINHLDLQNEDIDYRECVFVNGLELLTVFENPLFWRARSQICSLPSGPVWHAVTPAARLNTVSQLIRWPFTVVFFAPFGAIRQACRDL